MTDSELGLKGYSVGAVRILFFVIRTWFSPYKRRRRDLDSKNQHLT